MAGSGLTKKAFRNRKPFLRYLITLSVGLPFLGGTGASLNSEASASSIEDGCDFSGGGVVSPAISSSVAKTVPAPF